MNLSFFDTSNYAWLKNSRSQFLHYFMFFKQLNEIIARPLLSVNLYCSTVFLERQENPFPDSSSIFIATQKLDIAVTNLD